ncbi:MAG: YceG family protein [Lachnospiraceae bacterium]|nr:YceG family protein [Lachnospiraceae bacterium]
MQAENILNTPGCYRVNGYCKEFSDFIISACNRVTSGGCIINGGLDNPNASNVAYFTDKMGTEFQNNVKFFETVISKWLPNLHLQGQHKLSLAITEVFGQLTTQGKNASVLQNYYVKLMCWLYTKLASVLTRVVSGTVPVVIYTGVYDTYRLRTMQILSLYGCCVIYIDTTLDANKYAKCDPTGECSTLLTFSNPQSFPVDWNISKIFRQTSQLTTNNSTLGNRSEMITVKLNLNPDFYALGLKPCRLIVNGTDAKYNNTVYEYRDASMCLIGSIAPVRPDEILVRERNFRDVTSCYMVLLRSLNVGTIAENTTAKYAFIDSLTKLNITNTSKCIGLFYICMRFNSVLRGGRVLWLNPVFSATERFVLSFLSYFNMQLVLLNPNKTELSLEGFQTQELAESCNLTDFPNHRLADSFTTLASTAESKIHNELFNGELGIFKDHQFSRATVTYLDCTYDEINILLKQELRFRAGFDVVDGVVKLPTVFAVINGVPNGNLREYYAVLRDIREGSIVRYNTIYSEQATTVFAAECMDRMHIDFDRVQINKNYHYKHLRHSVQQHLLSAAQQLFDSGTISGVGKHGIENTVMTVLFNVPEQFLLELQNFDFTRKSPTLINIRLSNEQMSLEDTVLTTYLSLLGFDVVFVVPTGYNVLNSYTVNTQRKVFEFGNYVYDFDSSKVNKKSFFDKMIRRK